MRANKRPLTVLFVLLSGCSFGVFSDLEDKAPAARVNQDDSEISSSSFGDHIVGLPRGASKEMKDATGGVLAITGNGDAAFASATVAGGVRVAHAERSQVKDNLDAPIRITAMAAAPSNELVDNTISGPFAWVGSTSGEGSVRVLDVLTFKRIGAVHKAPNNVFPVTEFGASVAAANLDGTGGGDDLAVGAKSALVLLLADNSGGLRWPSMKEDTPLTVSEPAGSDWPSGSFSVIAAGNLDSSTPEDEVVAAVPEKNAVVVVHHISDCFKDTSVACKSYVRVRASDADRFGSALLVADVDDDKKPELVVGAPGVNKVYVYDLDSSHFDAASPAKLPDPTVLVAGTDVREFGASLAFGKLDGVRGLLAVGAPSTVVGGTSSAGRIVLYDTSLKEVGEGVTLATPEDKTLLGRNLTVIPYSKSGTRLDVLAAAGREAVFVFFASLTSDHKDVRK
jgi:hypothetical protein